MKAEHSGTLNDNEDAFAAEHTIDLNLDSYSYTTPGSDGKVWLKITLSQIHCVEKVFTYLRNGSVELSYPCTSTSCSCKPGVYDWCILFQLTVSIQGASPNNLPPETNCKYGDTVTLEKTYRSSFSVYELAVVGKAFTKG